MKKLLILLTGIINYQILISQTIHFTYDFNKNLIVEQKVGTLNFTVVNTLNGGPGSLRQVIMDACPEDTIRFSPILANDTITLSSSEIDLNRNIYILGLGINEIVISGENSNRIFVIDPSVDIGIESLRLIGGYNITNGGAIYNQGDLLLKDIEFQNNKEGPLPKAFTNKGIIEVQGQVIVKE